VDEGSQDNYAGLLRVRDVAWGCCDPALDPDCPSLGAWHYDVLVQGSADRAILYSQYIGGAEVEPWQESHRMSTVYADVDGYWTEFYSELAVQDTSDCATLGECADRWNAGVDTLLPCGDLAADQSRNWAVRLYKYRGRGEDRSLREAACFAWGGDPSSLAEQFDGCQIGLPGEGGGE
jgi:hypothetical protein